MTRVSGLKSKIRHVALEGPGSFSTKTNPSEQEIQKLWLNLLKIYSIVHWRYAVSALPHTRNKEIFFKRNPLAGFPDTSGVTQKGKFWVAEIKRPKNKPTDLQRSWLKLFEDSQCLTAVLTNYDEMIAFIKTILDN